jgi:mono/diheme cytochrome c family protein
LGVVVPLFAALALADEPRNRPRGLERAPASVRTLVNPFGGDPDSVRAGRKLFERHCVECHGDDARGRRKAPSLVSDRVRRASPGELFWMLKNGSLGVGMPAWSRLPEAQRWQLVSFLRSLQSPEEAAPTPRLDGGSTH